MDRSRRLGIERGAGGVSPRPGTSRARWMEPPPAASMIRSRPTSASSDRNASVKGPYGRSLSPSSIAPPTRTPKPSVRAIEVASVTRRVFPTPASPEMRTVDGAPLDARSRAARSRSSSTRRPARVGLTTRVDIAGIIDPASTASNGTAVPTLDGDRPVRLSGARSGPRDGGAGTVRSPCRGGR